MQDVNVNCFRQKSLYVNELGSKWWDAWCQNGIGEDGCDDCEHSLHRVEGPAEVLSTGQGGDKFTNWYIAGMRKIKGT